MTAERRRNSCSKRMQRFRGIRDMAVQVLQRSARGCSLRIHRWFSTHFHALCVGPSRGRFDPHLIFAEVCSPVESPGLHVCMYFISCQNRVVSASRSRLHNTDHSKLPLLSFCPASLIHQWLTYPVGSNVAVTDQSMRSLFIPAA